MSRRNTLAHRALGLGLASAALLISSVASAQSWVDMRSTPALTELVVVDATGEPGFPYGSEDVAGDGLAMFAAAEQAVDLRSGYAATDNARLWFRAYVSATGAADASLRVYWFVDADGDTATGGSAAAAEIEADFTTDPTSGGYDHVLGVGGDGTVLDFWDYRDAQGDFAPNAGGVARAEGEAGVDVDPLRWADDNHGYVQGSIELGDVALTTACNANFFVRAVSDEGNDLDVGTRVDCAAPDSNDNGVPNVVEVVTDCSSDADCPAGAVCISGECRYPTACSADTDCAAGESCVGGRCVVDGGNSCTGNADCDGLVCVSGTCRACGSGASCPSGQACSADGRCVAGTAGGGDGAEALVDDDEEVQGGALTCAFGHRGPASAAWLLLGLGLLVFRRRRTG